jgi:porin
LRPVDVSDPSLLIPAVTSLIYTPIFVNPTMIGVAPGYYNSAYGVTVNWVPNKSFYLDVGVYDGASASGVQTGLKEAPVFNGHYFMISEASYCWLLGQEELPGKIAAGGWVQTGEMYGPEELQPGGFKPKYQVQEEGAQGAYTYGSQRIWLRHPGVDNTGVSAFYQFGFNQSNTMLINRYFGIGATGFGLLPGRMSDSMGAGLAWSWLNRRYGFRGNEAMLQAYYQMHLVASLFLQPVVSYIPNPGASPQIQGAVAGTMQLMFLF